MADILVTGAAGFIASKVSEFLLAAGHRVVGIDNLNDYYDVRLKQYRLESLQTQPRFVFQQTDIENRADLTRLFEDFDFECVLNLAARAGVRYSIENPHVYFTTNTIGSLNLLELMRQRSVKKYVLASTSSLYAGQQMPFKETLPVNTPISPYAASKKAAEVMAYTYHHLFGIDVSVVRYFTVYGPTGRPDMSVFRFLQCIDQGQEIQLFGDGTQSRDFTYVDDIASGTIAAMKPLGYEIINLGGGNDPVSINEIIALLEGMLQKKSRIRHRPFHNADMKSTWADISKAKDLLGWQPAVSVQEGLQRTVHWYRECQPLASVLKLD